MKATATSLLGLTLAAALFFGVTAAEEKKSKKNTAKQTEENPDLKLKGGEEGTIFKSLRIEGEDRVRIEFERPRLDPDLNPYSAPGLDWENFHSVLERRGVGLVPPFLARSAVDRHPYYARPWLNEFVSGTVARFRPALEGVERWRLTVANSKGKTVVSFEGKGKPPEEIAWDGRSPDGKPVPPGYTYSYVLEAFDKAGNKRNFVGQGFELPSYWVKTSEGFAFLFAGENLVHARPQVGGAEPPPAILLEAASWINQNASANQLVRVEVTAQTFDDAKRIAGGITGHLESLLLGDAVRIQPHTAVEPDAPDRGTIAIVVASRSEPTAR